MQLSEAQVKVLRQSLMAILKVLEQGSDDATLAAAVPADFRAVAGIVEPLNRSTNGVYTQEFR
jgi:hypothetical protein